MTSQTKSVIALIGFIGPDKIERAPGDIFDIAEESYAEFVYNGRVADVPAKKAAK
jgi:hypothetical protein